MDIIMIMTMTAAMSHCVATCCGGCKPFMMHDAGHAPIGHWQCGVTRSEPTEPTMTKHHSFILFHMRFLTAGCDADAWAGVCVATRALRRPGARAHSMMDCMRLRRQWLLHAPPGMLVPRVCGVTRSEPTEPTMTKHHSFILFHMRFLTAPRFTQCMA